MLLAALVAMLVGAGCSPLPSAPPWSPPPADVPVGPSTGSTAAAALAALPVKGRAPKSGYERDRFGQRWADIDRNGCDQRNDVLARDLAAATFEPGTRDCVVRTGVLTDPYTGTTVTFVRGQDTSDDVPIDHVVAAVRRLAEGRPAARPSTSASGWRTTRSTFRPPRRPRTARRATPTPPPGSRPPAATAARTSPGRSRSRPPTGCGSPPPSGTRWRVSSTGARTLHSRRRRDEDVAHAADRHRPARAGLVRRRRLRPAVRRRAASRPRSSAPSWHAASCATPPS